MQSQKGNPVTNEDMRILFNSFKEAIDKSLLKTQVPLSTDALYIIFKELLTREITSKKSKKEILEKMNSFSNLTLEKYNEMNLRISFNNELNKKNLKMKEEKLRQFIKSFEDKLRHSEEKPDKKEKYHKFLKTFLNALRSLNKNCEDWDPREVNDVSLSLYYILSSKPVISTVKDSHNVNAYNSSLMHSTIQGNMQGNIQGNLPNNLIGSIQNQLPKAMQNGMPTSIPNGIQHGIQFDPHSVKSGTPTNGIPSRAMVQQTSNVAQSLNGVLQGRTLQNSASIPQKSIATNRPTFFANTLRKMESHGFDDLIENILIAVQDNRENPEDALFDDLNQKEINPIAFTKRKRRRVFYEEEKVVSSSTQAVDSLHSPIILRKTSFASKPHIIRNFEDGPIESSSTSKSDQISFAPFWFRGFSTLAKNYMEEKIDHETKNIYYEYISSHPEKNRKLFVFVDHSSDFSNLYHSQQLIRLVESVRIDFSDTTNSRVWKEQEIFLNSSPHDIFKQYRIISSAVDTIRLRLCNDISALLDNVISYNLTEDKNVQDTVNMIANANGIGYRDTKNDIAIELRIYHHGRRYTTPYIECRVALRKTIAIPSFVTVLDFSDENHNFQQSIPVGRFKFLNSKSILGCNEIFIKARTQFERIAQVHTKNALHMLKEWIKVIYFESKKGSGEDSCAMSI